MSGPLFVQVDWTKNGLFTDAGDDVTDRVRGPVSCAFGRDQITALSPVVAGRGQFSLDNRSRDYSPRNASSPLFGKVKPARPVVVKRTVGATTYTIFRAHTDDSPINPDLESKTVTLSCVDYLADFRGVTITTALYQGIRTGQAIGYILDAAGWTGGRDIDTGATVIPWWWEEGADAFDALQKVLASEGAPALLTIDTTGAVVYRDRHHRLVRSASTTSQSTWRGSVIEPIMGTGFSYSDNWSNIVNYVSLAVDERQPTGDLVEIWSSPDVISLGSGEVRTIFVQTTDPFFQAVTPVSGTDYNVTAGSLASITISRTSGAATSITLTASGSGATLDSLAIRANSVPVVRTYQVQTTDSTSITDYGQRSIPNGSEPVWASRNDVQAIANLLVLQRAQPLPLLNVRFLCQSTQTTRLTAILTSDISDRVTVIEPETQVNNACFVEYIQHNISSLAEHEVVFGLEFVPSSPTSAFILNSSTLNSAAPLGY
jgi:hypothetical protein